MQNSEMWALSQDDLYDIAEKHEDQSIIKELLYLACEIPFSRRRRDFPALFEAARCKHARPRFVCAAVGRAPADERTWQC